ncbi:MAG: hypothetical protein K8T90_04805 [Planctomycetes bacterium]|nr:hypothetical protein [Planctomycetota bacterium]
MGMLLGAGLCFGSVFAMAGLAWAITLLVGETVLASWALGVGSLVAPVVPVAALVWSIRRAVRTRRKGVAIGMALFAGLAVLLAVACAGLVFALR